MQRFINNWSTVLTAPATTAAASLSVPLTDAAKLIGLGAGDYYLLTLTIVDGSGAETAWEIVRVTGAAGGVLAVDRAQEGTDALELAAGTRISARITAATLASKGFWPYYMDKAQQDQDNSNTSLPTLRYGSLVNVEVAGSDVTGVNVYRMIPERDLLINRMTFSVMVMGGAGTELDLICGVVYDSDANGMPDSVLATTAPQDLASQKHGGVFVGGEILLEAGKPYWLGTHTEIVTPGVQLSVTSVDKAGENLHWYIYGLYSYDAIWADVGASPGSTPANWAAKVDVSPVNLQWIPVVGIGEKNV